MEKLQNDILNNFNNKIIKEQKKLTKQKKDKLKILEVLRSWIPSHNREFVENLINSYMEDMREIDSQIDGNNILASRLKEMDNNLSEYEKIKLSSDSTQG